MRAVEFPELVVLALMIVVFVVAMELLRHRGMQEVSVFNQLRWWGRFNEVVGWIITVGAAVFFIISLGTALGKPRSFEGAIGFAAVLPSLAGIAIGIATVIYGQMVRCFVAIEENTRETNRLLQSLGLRQRSAQGLLGAEKKTVTGSILGLSETQQQTEMEVGRLTAQRQESRAATCPGCGRAFPAELKGRFCEECGARLSG